MITEFLNRLAAHDDTEAIVEDGRTTTYRELVADVHAYASALREHGVDPGAVVALEASHSARSAAALLAAAHVGAICVPMTEVPDAVRAEYLDVSQAEAVVAVDPATGRLVPSPTGVRATHPLHGRLRAEGSPGLVLFSSGTTGRAKGTVLDLGRLLAGYDGAGRASRTLSFLNLDHIGGVNTLLHTLVHGGTLVTVRRRTPEEVFAAIEEFGVEVLPTTPTFLTMTLISRAHEQHDVSTLRLVTYGTEPMPAPTLRGLTAVLPGVRFKQTYGLSELGIMATRSRSDDSLWVQLGGRGFDYKVVDGVLWIRSETALLGYLNAAARFDADGYFDTQDAVEVDGEYLRILGRTSELINVAGEKVYPNEVESAMLEIANIADVTVSGLASPVTGQVVQAAVSLVEPEDSRALRRRIDAHLRSRLDAYKVPAKVVVVDRPHHSARFKKVRTS